MRSEFDFSYIIYYYYNIRLYIMTTQRQRWRGGPAQVFLSAAVVVNHVNARARSLFDFSRRCRFFRPDISHRWIIPDAVRQIIARSLFPGRVVGGNSNPLKNDLLSAARIYACLAYTATAPLLWQPPSPPTPGRPPAEPGADPAIPIRPRVPFEKKYIFIRFFPVRPAASYIHINTHVRKPIPRRSPSYVYDVQRPPEPDRTRRVISLVTDSSLLSRICVV